ncbi:MATE family efflux transporter [soil metagenome]
MSYEEEMTTAGAHHPSGPPPPRSRLRADLREAIRGSSQDYTEGPIDRALLLLAVPMVLETVMESVFALVDVFWVSRLGSNAITVVGLTESLLILIYTLALGLSIGATATVARRIGEKDPEGAARSAVQAIALGFAVAAALGVLGVVYAPELLALMGASPTVVAEGSGYARIMYGGNATVLLLFLLNAVFRGAGDAAIAMRVLWLANGINIVLGPFFIFGLGPFPEMGVTGAAIATNIGRGTAVIIQLVTLFRGKGRVRVRREHLHLEPEILSRIVRLSGSGTFQIFVGEASFILLIRILSGFGTEVVAGYTIALRLVIFALLPAWGLSNAAATIVGQSLGAAKPERAERSVRLAGYWNMAVLGFAGLVFVVFAPLIVSAFTTDPEPARWGVMCLRIVGLGFPFYGYGMVMTQAFNGAGDTRTPTLVNIGVFWLFELPAAWFLSRHGLGPNGVFLAITIAYSTVAVVGGALFRRGRWKETRV